MLNNPKANQLQMREVGFGSGVVWSRGHDDCFVALFLLSTSKLSHRVRVSQPGRKQLPQVPNTASGTEGKGTAREEADSGDQSFLSSSVSSGL